MTTETVAELFDRAIEKYQAGESAANLIPTFVTICDRSPKLNSAWTCLSWLYLLEDKPKEAIKAAQKSLKIDPYDPQTRINMALALLETKQPGVREHVEMAQQLLSTSKELYEQALENTKDGFTRKPDWASLQRIKEWIFED
jgi:predicted Zn-dependent protease